MLIFDYYPLPIIRLGTLVHRFCPWFCNAPLAIIVSRVIVEVVKTAFVSRWGYRCWFRHRSQISVSAQKYNVSVSAPHFSQVHSDLGERFI